MACHAVSPRLLLDRWRPAGSRSHLLWRTYPRPAGFVANRRCSVMSYPRRRLVSLAELQLRRTPTIRLAAVAKACGVSVATLARAVHTEMGLTFRAWQLVTIQSAARARMVEVPLRSIKEISGDLGFASPAASARWVRRQMGLSPSAWRASLGPSAETGTKPARSGSSPRGTGRPSASSAHSRGRRSV